MNFLKKGNKTRVSQAANDETKIVGHADIFSDGRIRGWALDLDDPQSTLWIDVFSSGGFMRSYDADVPRPDLENLYFKHDKHGFDFTCGLSPAGMEAVYLIARRKDTSAKRATPNLTTQFFQAAHAECNQGVVPLDGSNAAHAIPASRIGSSPASTICGSEVNAVLRIALAKLPATMLTSIDDPALPVFALSGAAPVSVPTSSSKAILSATKRLEQEQSCIIVDRLLQHAVDYRSILNAAFDKLKIGGFLIVTVPSQILYERKLQLPSRLPTKYKKFYTAGVLLNELEESIDPFTFRVRCVGDLDAGYVADQLDQVPEGEFDLVAMVEKVKEPPWLGALKTEDAPTARSNRPTDLLKPARTSPYIIVAPDKGELKDILILQLDHRGDYIMGVEARQLIRNVWPDAKITLLCGSWNEQDARASGTVDDVIAFNFFPEDASAKSHALSFSEQAEVLTKLIAGRSFDLAMDLRLNTDTRELLTFVSSRIKAGFDSTDDFPWLDIRMPTVDPDLASKVWQKFVPAAELHTCGEHNFLNIRVNQEDWIKRDGGSVLWGPYLDLPPGRYEIKLNCDCAVRTELRFDICANEGHSILGAGAIKVGPFSHDAIHLWLPDPAKGMEVRVYALPGGRPYPPMTFNGLHIVRRASMIGLHRTENMNLLVHLVAMRMQNASRIERIMEHAAE